ncbi:hypothetical protein ACE193_14140 [Bernardetia sp. OM2101]|uniref:hypothetical protein n=1 Tax=Bernardetia sp. OM2101 TaxID=3344876 RepID=UPI0035CECB97
MLYHFQKKLDSNSKIRFLIGFLILLIFQIWSTYKGVAQTHDSVQYLKTAENLVLNYTFYTNRFSALYCLGVGFSFFTDFFGSSDFLAII